MAPIRAIGRGGYIHMYVCICECSRAWRCLISGADTHLVLTSGYVAFFMRRISKKLVHKVFQIRGEKHLVVCSKLFTFSFFGVCGVCRHGRRRGGGGGEEGGD